MNKVALSSLILLIGFVNVNSLPDNPDRLMNREELLEWAKKDFSIFMSMIESRSPSAHNLDEHDFANLGYELFEKKQFDDAEWSFQTAFMMKPLTMYLNMEALCHLEKKDFDLAITVLKRALSKYPNNMRTQSHLVRALFESGKFDDAVKDTLPLLAHTNLQYLGEKYTKINKFDEALHCFNEGLQKSPGNTDLLLARATCNFKMDREDEGKSDFAAATSGPNTPFWTYYLFTDFMFSEGQFDVGLREGTRNFDEIYLLTLAGTFFEERKYEYTIRVCDAALTRDVFALPFYRLRALSRLKLGDKNAAVEDFRTAFNVLQNKADPRIKELLDRSPTIRTDILYYWVNMLFAIGKPEEAEQAFHKFDETDFKCVVGAFLSERRLDHARRFCDRGLEKFPHSKELKKLRENCEAIRIGERESLKRKLNVPAENVGRAKLPNVNIESTSSIKKESQTDED